MKYSLLGFLAANALLISGMTAHPADSSTGQWATEGSRTPKPVPALTPPQTSFREGGSPLRATVDLVSINKDGTATGNHVSGARGITANGRYVLFGSLATDLTHIPDTNTTSDLFVRDRETGTTELISVNDGGTAALGLSPAFQSSITPDGRFVLYNRAGGIFVRDRQHGTTTRVTVNPNGEPASGYGNFISDDGRYVFFTSANTGLVAFDRNGRVNDVFRRDLLNNTTTMVTADKTLLDNAPTGLIAASPDGRFVLFQVQYHGEVFMSDLQAKTIVHVSATPSNFLTTGIYNARMSDDGRIVVFNASGRGTGADSNRYLDEVFMRDLLAETTVSIKPEQGGTPTLVGDISANGQIIALIVGQRIYIHDRATNTTDLMTGGSSELDMDPSGRFVAFRARTAHLVDGDTNQNDDIFVHDRQLRTNVLMSRPPEGYGPTDYGAELGQGIGELNGPKITDDGQAVVFFSHATNLVATPKYPALPNNIPFGDVYVGSVRPSERLLNISTRGQVETGDNVLIGGFVLSGTEPKRIVVRAIGPSLQNAHIQGALLDPTLRLVDASGAEIAANDNWMERQAEIEATGLPPANFLEAAVVKTLAPGAYTTIVQGKNGTTGVGLVEVYDLEPAKYKLGNISTRGLVGTGDNVLIAGFIADGGATRLLIRAVGPSLAAAGVSGELQDPTLEVRNASGFLVASNDNWQETQLTEIQATGLPPVHESESATLLSLASSPYTVIVRGNNETTGVGLVEVYTLN